MLDWRDGTRSSDGIRSSRQQISDCYTRALRAGTSPIPATVYLVDPVAAGGEGGKLLHSLGPMLSDPRTLKLMHDCRKVSAAPWLHHHGSSTTSRDGGKAALFICNHCQCSSHHTVMPWCAGCPAVPQGVWRARGPGARHPGGSRGCAAGLPEPD